MYNQQGVKMATNVDIIIENQTDIKGPLTINLHLNKDQTPIKIILDDNTSSPSSANNRYKIDCLRKVIGITALIIILLIIILLGGIFASSNVVMNSTETKSPVRIVSRDEWLARPSEEPLDNLVLPVHRVIIAHTATSNCYNQATCTSQLLNIQNFHIESRHLYDIMYNFLIGGDGTVYEGRGWNAKGAHTKGFNEDTICVAFIGTFTTVKPSEKQLNAGKSVIDEGVRINKLVKDYRLYGARQFVGTESPGSALYEIIQQWPNWSNTTNL